MPGVNVHLVSRSGFVRERIDAKKRKEKDMYDKLRQIFQPHIPKKENTKYRAITRFANYTADLLCAMVNDNSFAIVAPPPDFDICRKHLPAEIFYPIYTVLSRMEVTRLML